jgi:hypothetical protein
MPSWLREREHLGLELDVAEAAARSLPVVGSVSR